MTNNMHSLITRLRKLKHPEEFEEKEENPVQEEEEGIEIPVPGKFQPEMVEEESQEENLSDVDIKYPLIPSDPDEGETVYAWAYITWDEDEGELVYHVIEPELDHHAQKALDRIKKILERSFSISLEDVGTEEAQDYLNERIDKIIDKYDINIGQERREKIRYYIKRDFVGLGRLEPLMKDTEIEDISCDGVDIPVYAYHRNPKFGSVRTNIVWNEKDELDSFVMKLAQRAGRSISVAQPLLDGALPDGSRVQATLATDIARKGSNFTIRRFTEDPLTPIHMMDFNTEDARMLSYLWTLIERGKSALICGTTGAGKTSQLNALSLFIKPEKKIVSIEDTPELRLPHDHWVPEVARSGFGSSAEEGGEVSMDNLLKESLRQRPEYIIVGEVRGAEAYILFQQMATGHTGLSTLHADSLEMLMDRLTTDPIDLSPSLIETLDLVMMIARIRRGGNYIRRVKGIYEIRDYDERKGLDANKVFEWDPEDDDYKQVNNSLILQDIADESAMDYDDLKEEMRNRQHVLKYMQDEQIKHYRDVGDLIARYYWNKNEVLEKISQKFNSYENKVTPEND